MIPNTHGKLEMPTYKLVVKRLIVAFLLVGKMSLGMDLPTIFQYLEGDYAKNQKQHNTAKKSIFVGQKYNHISF